MSSAWSRKLATKGLIGSTCRNWQLRQRRAVFVNFQDPRGTDRLKIGVAEFQVHAAADEPRFQHRAAPCGSVDRYRHGLGAKYRMPRNQRLVPALVFDGVGVVLSLHL